MVHQAIIEHNQWVVPGKWHLSCQHLIEHYAKSVNVAPGGSAFRFHLFRRDVVGRAHCASKLAKCQSAPVRCTGDAEIDQLDVVLGVDHNVFRFQIAMHDVAAVNVL